MFWWVLLGVVLFWLPGGVLPLHQNALPNPPPAQGNNMG
jgi:hypothetical protein